MSGVERGLARSVDWALVARDQRNEEWLRKALRRHLKRRKRRLLGAYLADAQWSFGPDRKLTAEIDGFRLRFGRFHGFDNSFWAVKQVMAEGVWDPHEERWTVQPEHGRVITNLEDLRPPKESPD